MARTMSTEVLVSAIPADQRATVDAARRMVRSIAPKAVEVPYHSRPPAKPSTMWKLARYTLNGENVVGIGTYTKHSTLYFYRGRELDDRTGMLEGTGKEMRSVTLREPADVGRPMITQLIRKAFALSARERRR